MFVRPIYAKQALTLIVVSFVWLLLSSAPAYSAADITDAENSLSAPPQQVASQVYGIRGKLRTATNQPFGNYFDTLDNRMYGVIGSTAQIEQQIIGFANSNPSVLVKIWGTVQSMDGDVQVIIVSGVLPDQPVVPTAVAPANYPIGYLKDTGAVVRRTPVSNGEVVARLAAPQRCPVTARLADNSWWYLRCSPSIEGWVNQNEVYVVGQLTDVAVEGSPATPIPTSPPTPTVTPTPSSTPIWRSAFFNNTTLSGAPVWTSTTLEPNVNWRSSSPSPSVPVDNFSARFERIVDLSAGNYRLQVQADDGVRLFLDGQLVVNAFHALTAGAQSYRVDRILSGPHSIRIEFVEFTGDAYLYFALYPLVVRSEWTVGYFNNPNLSGAAISSAVVPRSGVPIDVNWGGQSPLPGVIPPDNWSTRWEGSFDFEAGGYTFYANADDGVRIYFDNRLILDSWNDGVHQNLSAVVNSVTSGGHDLKVEQYERNGGASLRVWWTKNQANGPQ